MISVIIPVYNIQGYLERCIRSVLDSSYGDFEVILVDDGSLDDSPKICRAWCARDSRVRFVSQRHRGVSAARNRGIKISRGQWIVFVDGDDLISPDFLETVARQEYGRCDLLLFDLERKGTWRAGAERNEKQRGRKPGGRNRKAQEGRVYGFGKAHRLRLVETLLDMGQPVRGGSTSLASPCAKAYKKAVIDRYGLRFAEDIVIGEDRLFNIQFLLRTESGAYIRRTVYHITLRPDSAMRGYYGGYLENDLRYQRRLRRILTDHGILPGAERAYYNSVLSNMADVLVRGIFNPRSEAGFGEKRGMCERMQRDGIYREAMRHNGKAGVMPRRLLLFFLRRGWYGLAGTVSRVSYKVLERTERL